MGRKREFTYAIPRLNMKYMLIFLDVCICSFHSTGMGIITTARSIARLMMAWERSTPVCEPHVPWSVGSHSRARGRQTRKALKTIKMLSKAAKTVTVEHAMRTNRFVQKSSLKSCRMDILMARFAKPQRNSAVKEI